MVLLLLVRLGRRRIKNCEQWWEGRDGMDGWMDGWMDGGTILFFCFVLLFFFLKLHNYTYAGDTFLFLFFYYHTDHVFYITRNS